jgi:nitrogen regulatory protein PII
MSMTVHKLLTIVVEAAIERQIVAELERAGVSGFTSVEARGVGDRGRRSGDWDQNRSVRIETVCDPATATSLADRLLERWGPDYAIVVWLQNVEVFRGGKFDTH